MFRYLVIHALAKQVNSTIESDTYPTQKAHVSLLVQEIPGQRLSAKACLQIRRDAWLRNVFYGAGAKTIAGWLLKELAIEESRASI